MVISVPLLGTRLWCRNHRSGPGRDRRVGGHENTTRTIRIRLNDVTFSGKNRAHVGPHYGGSAEVFRNLTY